MFKKLRIVLCAVVVFALLGVLSATAQQISDVSVPDGLEPLAEEFEPVDLVQEENPASVIRKGPAPAITVYKYHRTYKASDTGEVVVSTWTEGYGSKVVIVDGVVATIYKSEGILDSANVAKGFIDYYRTGRMPSDFNKKYASQDYRMFYIKAQAISIDGTTHSIGEEQKFLPSLLRNK